MHKKSIILLTLVFLVAACVPAQSSEDAQSQVNTAVAQTMEARQEVDNSVAQTVAAQNSLSTPTAAEDLTVSPTADTTLAFPTVTEIIPTITALPPVVVLPTSTRRPQKPEYACSAINRKPLDNTEFNKNAKFDIKWTIVNTGTKTWPAGYDVKYFSGPQMATPNRVEINKEMKPGDTFVVNLDAVAPDKKGFYVMTWTLDNQLCYPYVAIYVK